MSLHRPISKTILNQGGLEKTEDSYVIRKEKG